jgi:hypothetical protein
MSPVLATGRVACERGVTGTYEFVFGEVRDERIDIAVVRVSGIHNNTNIDKHMSAMMPTTRAIPPGGWKLTYRMIGKRIKVVAMEV